MAPQFIYLAQASRKQLLPQRSVVVMFDPKCLHGGPGPSEAKALAPLVMAILCDPRLQEQPFDPMSLRPFLDRFQIPQSVPALLIAIAGDAFGKQDYQSSRTFIRAALAVAGHAKAIWDGAGQCNSEEKKLVRNCIDDSERSIEGLKMVLQCRTGCCCFGRPSTAPDGKWRGLKDRGTASFKKKDWGAAAIQYEIASLRLLDQLQDSLASSAEADSGVHRVLHGICPLVSEASFAGVCLEVAKLNSNASLCHLRLGDADLALFLAERSVHSAPHFAKGYARRGDALAAAGHYDEAMEALSEAMWHAGTAEEAEEYERRRSLLEQLSHHT